MDAVLANNLHGLELDARCVEIAVFALALAAWRFPDENGDPLGARADMPTPQVACCGLKVAAKPEDWMALVPDDAANASYLRQELRLLHASFAQAPLLGSLLDPARSLKNDLATSSFDTLRDLLGRALATERPATLWGQSSELQDDSWDLALTARGLLDAARLLDGRYHLVVTNVPYLARGKQDDVLRSYCDSHYPDARNDLANVFLERCLEFSTSPSGGRADGVVQVVMPQNWLFLASYKSQRESLLRRVRWNLLARLGPGAFETISGEVVQAVLITQTVRADVESHLLRGIDVTSARQATGKASLLREGALVEVLQSAQLNNPGLVISLESINSETLLAKYAKSVEGLSAGDSERFIRSYWELSSWNDGIWEKLAGAAEGTTAFGGLSRVFKWEGGQGEISRFPPARIRGHSAWGKRGVLVGQMGSVPRTLYFGDRHEKITAAIVPYDQADLPAIWAYCSHESYLENLRKVTQKMSVSTGSLVNVPFDIDYWRRQAKTSTDKGLLTPYSDDPTQWLFHGHPQRCIYPLQVAVARLAGYSWPAEADAAMELSDDARTWIARCESLSNHTDNDGIVCLSSVRGETPAHDRLLKLLIAAWETVQRDSWKPAVLDKLLADAECAGMGLDVWLRDKFFEQHAKCFHHRPFIWHVWDGLKDGFAALVNYHQLDQRKLERLIHTYLGDWIRQQEAGVRDRIDGAQQRLAAAQDLKRRLELILEGEPPYDIFVRWKSLSEQPIGWNPDLNDGVRLNIRPFMTAEVLRHNKKPKLNITWDKDRGKEVESAPWSKTFGGDRINDHHLSRAEKEAARAKAGRS